MNEIEEEVEKMGPLRNVAAAMVDYVKAGARASESRFNHYTEWTLEPDNWINIKFSRIRTHAIHVTLGVYDATLEEVKDITVSKGRRPQWSKLTIRSPSSCLPQ